MTDDIVARLRDKLHMTGRDFSATIKTASEAAGAIETLQKALTELVAHCADVERALTEQYYCATYARESEALGNARAALEGEKKND